MKNRVQLIAYADRFGGDVPGLTDLLTGPLAGLFAGVHVLPFFVPIDGADAGFDPTDHRSVDPRLGDWDDVAALGRVVDVMADAIVNHMSVDAPEFRDVVQRGAASPHVGMFLTYDRVFPDGAVEADLLRIYRPRPGLPFTAYTLGERTRRLFWTTFTSRQVDLDVSDRATRRYLRDILRRFADHGVTIVRLDAVGYAVKTPGTSSFMTADTLDFVDRIAAWAGELGMEVLVEVHSYYRRQLEIAARVDWVYDFALPPLVLHGLFTGDGRPLRDWLTARPENAVTVLDTHDGIGVIDVGPDAGDSGGAGLLDADQLDRLVETIHTNSGGGSRRATGAAASNVDLYQVNCTFYAALGRDDRAYLIARMLQLFAPGVPQIYYVGLLAGDDDLELLERTGVGRDVNRHRYTRPEIDAALERDVVRALVALIRLRNDHPAFDGAFALDDTPPDHVVAMRWDRGDDHVALTVDLAARTFEIVDRRDGRTVTHTDPDTLAGS